MSSQLVWKVVVTGSAVLTATLMRSILREIWRAWKGDDPPLNPASPETGWSDALIWTVAVGSAIGVGRLVARRGAARGWRKVTGNLPPGLES